MFGEISPKLPGRNQSWLNPWSAGSASGSAVGGDGTATSTGQNSIAYGINSTSVNSVFANPGFAFGDNVVMGAKSFASGRGITVNPSANYGAFFGDSITIANGGNYCYGFGQNLSFPIGGSPCFAWGTGCVVNGNYGVALGNVAIVTNNGSVVWGDSNSTPQTDTAGNQMALSFAGGFMFYKGDFSVATVGKGLRVKEGSNAKQGTVTLSSGVGVVSNTSVTANSRIFYCAQDTNTVGFLNITARTASSGFTITSSVLTDSGVVAYEIFEPA